MLRWLVALVLVVGLQWKTANAQTTLVRAAPFDWSHRHVVATGDRAIQGSTIALRDHRLAYAWLTRTYRAQLRAQTLAQSVESDEMTLAGLPLRLQPPVHRPISASAESIDWQVPLGAPMADGTFPAKYAFNLPGEVPTCNDYVVYGLNAVGTAAVGATLGQANLVGLNNLYSGTAGGNGLCGTGSATIKFAYNGSTIQGSITNSVVLSELGDKVAYVESTSTGSVLHVVVIPSATGGGTVSAPVVPASLKTVPSTGTWAADSHSSVWVDYSNDVAYVGTDDGKLHKVQNVFCTTSSCNKAPVDPSEVTASPWPVTLVGAGPLTSPVQDGNSIIYVSGASNGKLYAVTSAGTVTASSQSFMPNSIVDGPILDIGSDGTTQALYWFSNSHSAASNPSVRQPQLVQTNSTLTTFNNFSLLLNSAGLPAGTVAWDNLAVSIFTGTFDDAFYSNRLGNLWTCAWWQNGQYAGNHLVMARFKLNDVSVTPDGTAYTQMSQDWLSSSNYAGGWQNNQCSPLTEVLDSSGTDRIFVGSKIARATGQCADYGSCIYGFTSITTPLALSATYFLGYDVNLSPPQPVKALSGIVVDNVASPSSYTCGTGTQTCAQTSSIYFVNDTNAIKLTQSGLQ